MYTLHLKIENSNAAVAEYYEKLAKEVSLDNAGIDLMTCENWNESTPHLLNLGVSAMLERTATGEVVHYWLLPRSSIYKTGYIMANSVGVIDKTYRGILKAPVVNVGGYGAEGFVLGARHFQIVAPDMGPIGKVLIVDFLPETVRGSGGFGSTGK
jgi:dUTPase